MSRGTNAPALVASGVIAGAVDLTRAADSSLRSFSAACPIKSSRCLVVGLDGTPEKPRPDHRERSVAIRHGQFQGPTVPSDSLVGGDDEERSPSGEFERRLRSPHRPSPGDVFLARRQAPSPLLIEPGDENVGFFRLGDFNPFSSNEVQRSIFGIRHSTLNAGVMKTGRFHPRNFIQPEPHGCSLSWYGSSFQDRAVREKRRFQRRSKTGTNTGTNIGTNS